MGITGARWRRAGVSSNYDQRTAANGRDQSRTFAGPPIYPLHRASGRAVRQGRAPTHPACHPEILRSFKARLPQGRDREGEKYLVAPYSVDRHITYINEVRTVANTPLTVTSTAAGYLCWQAAEQMTIPRGASRWSAEAAPQPCIRSIGYMPHARLPRHRQEPRQQAP
jgi:hypothetical protein